MKQILAKGLILSTFLALSACREAESTSETSDSDDYAVAETGSEPSEDTATTETEADTAAPTNSYTTQPASTAPVSPIAYPTTTVPTTTTPGEIDPTIAEVGTKYCQLVKRSIWGGTDIIWHDSGYNCLAKCQALEPKYPGYKCEYSYI